MEVPFMDLKRQYSEIKAEIDHAMQETFDSCSFVAGKQVSQFEQRFAEYCGVQHAVGVSSGTSALYIALKALGVGKSDIVITVPYTFIATVEAITLTGARPLFVDIEKDSYNISLEKLKNYIERGCKWDSKKRILVDKRTNLSVKGLIPVHLYGLMSDMDQIMEIARQYNLFVLEDAAQAHGALYKDRKAGSIGQIGCFSFYPSKNLGAYGQAGAATTTDTCLAEKMRMFIDHGQREKYQHIHEGWNFKMDGLQAAVLRIKLGYLDRWNSNRRKHAQQYSELLKDTDGIVLPAELPGRKHVYHLYVIHVQDRVSLQAYLHKAQIGYSIHYPIALHLQNAYHYLGYKSGDFPNTEECAQDVLSLPMFPELTSQEIQYVCSAIKQWSKNSNFSRANSLIR